MTDMIEVIRAWVIVSGGVVFGSFNDLYQANYYAAALRSRRKVSCRVIPSSEYYKRRKQ